MIFSRILELNDLMEKKSFFLFGPRATGKSFLIKQQLMPKVPVINLLDSRTYFDLSATPERLESMIMAFEDHSIVVIDEVQRVPELLNEVHRLIEDRGIKFLLTGSSARKLRQGQANLLAGRARQARLFPLTSREIPAFDLGHYLRVGGLPSVYLSQEPEDDLDAYVNTYLKEEIQAEALVRKIPSFTRFLKTSALTSGQMMNFTQIASDAGIPVSTVREYYQILEDTFLGFLVPAYTKTKKRKAISMAKFYYFDIGVRNALAGITSIPEQSDLYGQAFEHFIGMEIQAYLAYRRMRQELTYWRSKNGQEVDYIIGDQMAIEVKTTQKVHDKHFKHLRALSEEGIIQRFILVSRDQVGLKVDGIEAIYWERFLELLWEDRLVI